MSEIVSNLRGAERFAGTLELLACDLSARPAAPGPDDLLPSITHVEREPDKLLISFDPSALAMFTAFAAAESLCCSGLEWVVDDERQVLRITAAPAQLDALQVLFSLR